MQRTPGGSRLDHGAGERVGHQQHNRQVGIFHGVDKLVETRSHGGIVDGADEKESHGQEEPLGFLPVAAAVDKDRDRQKKDKTRQPHKALQVREWARCHFIVGDLLAEKQDLFDIRPVHGAV